ncbi:hypothetical protein NCCP2050_00680 [Planococcus sp. NCCP-2050]|nr:hypothetical protein NCCP2050_00680 [Planococcus sp. NCCP-2050]
MAFAIINVTYYIRVFKKSKNETRKERKWEEVARMEACDKIKRVRQERSAWNESFMFERSELKPLRQT